MGLKEEKRFLRGVKTLFFLITMLFSLLLFSAPVLLVIADMFLPSAILSINHPSLSLSLESLSSHLKTYDFRSSLIDIPLLSIVRSAVIFCVYCFCDGPRLSRGPYLGIATFCSSLSLIFVSVKASFVLGSREGGHEGCIRGMELALILSSLVLAVGHIVVAYRTSCRERRKLLIYKIDIEALLRLHNVYKEMGIVTSFLDTLESRKHISSIFEVIVDSNSHLQFLKTGPGI